MQITAATVSPSYAQVPTFEKTFSPNTIGPGSISTLTFVITNVSANPVTGLAFVDNLPVGTTIAMPANASTDCDEATLTAPNGGGTITFAGGRVGPTNTCIASVNVTSSTVGTHTNVSGDLTSSAGNSGTATADLNLSANLPGFSKSFAPSTIPRLGRSTLTFTIDNTPNPAQAANLIFNDNLPSGMVVADPANITNTCQDGLFTGGLVTAIPGSNLISLGPGSYPNWAAVGPGASCTIGVDVLGMGLGQLENTTSELTSTLGSSGMAGAILDVTSAYLSKQFTDDPVAPGGTTTLAFTILNTDRSGTMTNLAFTDDLDATLSGLAVSGSLPSDPCGAGSVLSGTTNLSLTGGSLPAGGTCTFSVTLDVPAGAAQGAYVNTTSAMTGNLDGAPIVDTPATDILFVSAGAKLTKEFTDDPVAPGGTVNLQFTLNNEDAVNAASNISFTDELTTILPFPLSVTLPPAPCGPGSGISIFTPSTDRQGLMFTGGSLAPSGTCTFDVTVDVPAGATPGMHTNITSEVSATVGGTTVLTPPAVDELVIVSAPQFSKEFTDDPVVPGGTVTLEFTISNGPENSTATGISFTDDLNATLAGLTATGLPLNNVCGAGSMLTGSVGDTFITLSDGQVEPGTSCTFTVSLLVPASATSGSYTNTTSPLASTVAGLPVVSPAATDDLQIADLTFTKSFTDDPVVPGGTVTLEFTLDNQDQGQGVTNIAFSDDLDAALSGLVATGLPQSGVCGPGSTLSGTDTVFLTGGNLLPGTACTFSVTLDVPGTASPGSYGNVTSNLSVFKGGNPMTFPPATDALIVAPVDEISLSKSFTDDPVGPGETVTLEFTIDNLSQTNPANDVTFTDDLDAVLSGLSVSGLLPSDPCGAGSMLTGTNNLSFSGGLLPAGGSCTFSIDLLVPGSATSGSYGNTTSVVTATGFPNGAAATDDLNISAALDNGSIGDRIWYDENGDGVQDAGETGIDGITVDLVNDVNGNGIIDPGENVLATETTAGGGMYDFLRLSADNYIVDVTDTANLLDGYFLTGGTDPHPVSLSSGQDYNDADFGYDRVIPDVTLSVDSPNIDEAAGQAIFTTTLSAETANTVTVNLDYSGTATGGTDYTGMVASITIPPLQMTGSFTTTATQDAIDENNETVVVDITSVTNGNEATAQQQTTTIVDDDDPPTVTLGVDNPTITENPGTATFTATLSAVSGLDVTIDLGITGTATDGTDFNISGSQITIPAGSPTGSVTVNAVDDALDENDETVIVDITGTTNATEQGTQQQTTTILDNDDPPAVTLSVDNTTIAENAGTATFTTTLDAVSGLDVTVDLGVTGTATDGTDFNISGTQISIPAGSTTGSVNVTAIQDALDENDETVIVDITGTTNATEQGSQVQTTTILDDDPPPTVSLSVDNTAIAENAGAATFTATLSAVSGLDVTVDLGITGTATDGVDYTGSTTQLVIPAGQTTAGFTINTSQDVLDEFDETVIVEITNVTNGTESGVQQQTTMITDDDNPPTVSLALDNTSIPEASGVAVFTSQLNVISGKDVTVDLGFSGIATLGTDYTTSGSQVIIPAGQTTQAVTVTASQDALDEVDESIVVDITGVTNGTEQGTQQQTAIIVDDDDEPDVTLSVDNTTITENPGTATFTATLGAVSSQDVTVDLGFTGTATRGTDYTETGSQIIIPAGQTSGNIAVTAVQDTRDEDDETVIVDITGVTNATEQTTQQQTTTILDDDDPPVVTLTVDTPLIAEDAGTATFSAILNNVSEKNVTIDLGFTGTADGSDFSATDDQITIPAGQTTGTITVTAQQDLLDENDETVVVDITGVINGTEQGDQQQTTTIQDDDEAPSVTLSVDDDSIAENGGSATFTASLSSVSSKDVTVELAYGGTASAGDYDGATTTLTIAAGSTTASFPVTAIDDAKSELDETIIVSVNSVTNAEPGDPVSASTTIIDDDFTSGLDHITEDGAPNNGDGNGDGIPDRLQENVASLPNATDGLYITLVTDDDVTFESVSVQAAATMGALPAGVSFPHGIIGFVVSLPPGVTSTTVEQILHGGNGITNYFKFGPDGAPVWYEFIYDGTTGAIITGNRVTLHLVDGLRGDHDLTVNGTISDPGGPVYAEADVSVGIESIDSQAAAGTQARYQIMVSNLGPGDANNIQISHEIPDEFTDISWTSSSEGGATGQSAEGTGAILETVNLPVNGRLIYDVKADINTMATGTVTYSAEVIIPDTFVDTVPTNNLAQSGVVVTSSVDLVVTHGADVETAITGELMEYTVTILNKGPAEATSVTFSETLGEGLEFIDLDCVSVSHLGSVTIGNLGIDEEKSCTVTVRLNPSAPATVTSSVTASSDEHELNPSDNTNIVISTPVLVHPPDLEGTAEPPAGATDVSTDIKLKWSPVVGAVHYHLQVSDNENFGSGESGSKTQTIIVDVDTLSMPAYALSTLEKGTTYYWRVASINVNGQGPWSSIVHFATITATGIERMGGEIPKSYALEANYPNPFNPVTTIPFALPEAVRVRLAVYDMLGRELSVLADAHMPAGRYQMEWHSGDLPSGVYLVRLVAGSFVQVRTLVLLK